MSEHITHIAVLDDGVRLGLHSPAICTAFKEVLSKHLDIARMASTTRSGDAHTVKLLTSVRDRWAHRRPGDRLPEKLAFLLGWRCHLAADRTFKPVYRELQPEHYDPQHPESDEGPPSDVSIYHDVVVFREVYSSGAAEPFVRSALDFRLETHPAGRSIAVPRLERLWQSLWQYTLLEMQSRLAAEKDPDRWFKLFLSRHQPFIADVQRYAAAYYRPDPDRMRRYIVEPNFYDARDPIVALARSIQRGAPDRRISLDRAMEAATRQCQYAQALERACRYLQAASDFFENKIGEEELKARCDVGKAHVPAAKKR